MNQYLFVLGRAYDLCLAELNVVLKALNSDIQIQPLADPLVLITTKSKLNTCELVLKLGGTIKIAQVNAKLPQLTDDNVAKVINPDRVSSVDFGLSFYSPFVGLSKLFYRQIKQKLLKHASHVRFVLPKDGSVLSSVVVKKQKLNELIFYFDKVTRYWLVGQTLVVQDADEWNKRDYGRPYADPKIGMLPPKVARMMVNLINTKYDIRNTKLLLDPFCGMGTILAEALLTGWQVIGSDVSDTILTKAKANLDWLITAYQNIKISDYRLICSDATKISSKVAPNCMDAIVTEPFMGKLFKIYQGKIIYQGKFADELLIKNLLRGLQKLYIGAFRDWIKVLKPNGIVVMAFPQIIYHQQQFSVKNLIDTCEKLGYTRKQGPYIYARPQAIVQRAIHIFQKI